MSYIDLLQNKESKIRDMANTAIKNNDYNSNYMFQSSSIVPHPQKSRANCLCVTLYNPMSIKVQNTFDILFDEYEIIRTEKEFLSVPPKSRDIIVSKNHKAETKLIVHTNEQELLESETLFPHLLKSFHQMMYNEFGDTYIQRAINHREKNISTYKTAKAKANEYQYNVCASMTTDEILAAQGPSTNKKVKMLQEINQTIELLDTTISTQVCIISHLKSIAKQNNANQNCEEK